MILPSNYTLPGFLQIVSGGTGGEGVCVCVCGGWVGGRGGGGGGGITSDTGAWIRTWECTWENTKKHFREVYSHVLINALRLRTWALGYVAVLMTCPGMHSRCQAHECSFGKLHHTRKLARNALFSLIARAARMANV